jgi:hypothetical protein
MKIQTILFMRNDFARAKFTLENFRKHNPIIPIRVINAGGDSPKSLLSHISNIEFIDAPDLWHKKTHCGRGSFGPKFADYFFDFGLNENFTHTLLLETDVLTNRTITIEPKFDIAGPNNPCGPKEFALYDALNIGNPRIHTGCGGTIFSNKYFTTIKEKNLFGLFQELFDKFPQNYFMDMILTLIGRIAGLSFGHWEEVSNIPMHVVNNEFVDADMNATIIHNFKV